MRLIMTTVLAIGLLGAPLALAQTAQPAPDVAAQIAACAQDTGFAGCPSTYQAVRASDCLGAGNRSCLVRKATEAASRNDCDRAFQLVSVCQCGPRREAERDALDKAGPAAVCRILKGG
jgi:hypothetical protein